MTLILKLLTMFREPHCKKRTVVQKVRVVSVALEQSTGCDTGDEGILPQMKLTLTQRNEKSLHLLFGRS